MPRQIRHNVESVIQETLFLHGADEVVVTYVEVTRDEGGALVKQEPKRAVIDGDLSPVQRAGLLGVMRAIENIFKARYV